MSESRTPTTTRRKIGSVGAAALSLGFMGPVMAMALNGIGVAGLVGTSVPFVFLVAFVGTLIVAYSFARLAARYTHSGSVYALAGVTIGPRAGFFAGFALLGTYLFFAACILGACGVFFQSWLAATGTAISVPWPVVMIGSALLALLVNLRETKVITTILLVIGGLGIALMLVLGVVVLWKVGQGSAPHTDGLNLTPFLPHGAGASTVMTASVFAFISWAGFESCTSLAEETRNPKRAIPAALGGAVVIGGLVYVFVTYIQTVGFGISAEGAARFAASESSLIDIAVLYVGPWYAQLLAFSGFAVAFASLMSSSAAASRLLFALARDGFGPAALARVNPKTGVPRNAVIAVILISLLLAAGLTVFGVGAFDTYYWYATIAVLCLLVAYGMTSAGAITAIVVRKVGIPLWEAIIPVVAMAYLVYVFVIQIWGQEPPYTYFPWIAAAWCLTGLVVALARPGLARRIGASLLKEEGQ